MDWFYEAKKQLQQEKVILCPTDTVWGLSGNALNPQLPPKIHTIKNRPAQKSFIILMPSFKVVASYVDDDLNSISTAIKEFNKPTTVIYKYPKHLPPELLAADGSVGIRVPKSQWLIDFLKMLQFPLISTSANLSAQPTPLTFQDISATIISAVDYVVPFTPETLNTSSQICKFNDQKIQWIRR